MGGCTSTSTYNYAGDPSSSHVSSDLDFKNRPILGPCLGLTGFLNTSWSDLVLRKPQNMWIDCEYMSPTAILAHTNCKLQEAFQEVPMKAFTISNMARISSNCKFPSGKIVMGGGLSLSMFDYRRFIQSTLPSGQVAYWQWMLAKSGTIWQPFGKFETL